MRMFAVVVAATIAGCSGQSYADRAEELQRFVAKEQAGSAADYYLTKNGNDRVALVFGMGDDFAFCSELAELYMGRYPLDQYSCVPAQ